MESDRRIRPRGRLLVDCLSQFSVVAAAVADFAFKSELQGRALLVVVGVKLVLFLFGTLAAVWLGRGEKQLPGGPVPPCTCRRRVRGRTRRAPVPRRLESTTKRARPAGKRAGSASKRLRSVSKRPRRS